MSARVPMRGTGTEQVVVAMKGRNGLGAKGLPHCAEVVVATMGGDAGGRTAAATAKSLPIGKRQVWEAYKRVRANRGAAGVDGSDAVRVEGDVANNLYKLWNRLGLRQLHAASGSARRDPKI